VRARALIGTFTSLLALTAVSPALATTGGTTPGSTVHKSKHATRSNTGGATPASTTTLAPVKKLPKVPSSPVTSKTIPPPYAGPVYQELDTGEVVPYETPATQSEIEASTGGSPVGVTADTKPELLVPGTLTREINGLAAAPMSAPLAVQQMVWTANQIIGLPYIYGGGHASFVSAGYDCSGTVSYALHGASLLATPMDSGEFMSWGSSGVGRWVTIFTNPGHAYVDIAGLRLDTSPVDDPSDQQGPRWRPLRPANAGFMVRHPTGL
jgi:cell wall-associated NlpC family hydrolase